MSKGKELIKNTFIILIGKVCTQFLSFFLLPLYTSYLNSSQYGTVDLISTYIVLIVPIITLQLEMSIFRELVDNRENVLQKSKIISTGLSSAVVQLFIVLIFFISFSFFIKINYLGYIILNVIVVMFSNILLQIARGTGDNVGYSKACVISGIGTIIFNLIFIVWLNMKVEGMLLSIVLANFISNIYLIIRTKIIKCFSITNVDKKIRKNMLKYSLPLVPNGLIWWIINASDRTLITFFLGTGLNGIYAVSNKFSTILIQFYNVFNLSWTESASLHINDKDKDEFFTATFNNVIKVFYSFCILIISLLPFAFNLLVSNKFQDAYNYIPILLIGMVFNIIVSFIGCIYVAKKLTKEVAVTSFWSGVLNILINIILIKKIGVYAAAISTFLAFFIMALYRMNDVKKYVNLMLEKKQFFVLSFIFAFSCLSYYCFNVFLQILSLILIFILLTLFNKKSIIMVVKKLKR